MAETDSAQPGNLPRLEDLRADELRKWREMGATREEFGAFWPLILDRRLKNLRGRAA